MGIFRKFSQWHQKLSGHHTSPVQKKKDGFRRCRIEAVEPRRMLAADVVLAAVYLETDLGNDTQADIIEVSFEGGAAGTELTRIVIDGDKFPNGISSSDVIFDIAPGGLGDFAAIPYQAISNTGFQILGVEVLDGGSQIAFNLSGFNAGEKLVFSVDVDEANFVDQFGNVQVNSLVEGGEFENSIITGTFKAANYQDLTLTGTFKDYYDAKFTQVQAATGVSVDVHKDRWNEGLGEDLTNRTAGAIAHAKQEIIPAKISGYVYYDKDNDGLKETGEPGIAGVTIQVISVNTIDGTSVTKTTTTDANGYYEVTNLVPGTYRVVEVVQPTGYLDGKDTPGTVNGVTRGVSVVPDGDELQTILLNGGDAGINYNFGEILPASISGRVHGDPEGDCDFGPNDIPLENVRIDLFDAQNNLIATTFTDANGEYKFENLSPGVYKVFEHQPAGWLDSGDHVGTAGGKKLANDTIGEIVLGPGQNGENYDFCEEPPSSISGRVHADPEGDCEFGPNDIPLENVRIDLFNEQNQLIATTFTDANGEYKFENLKEGVYRVFEHQPVGYIDSGDHPGTVGGIALGDDSIRNINLPVGVDALHYDFCEEFPVAISGHVYHDRDDDGVRESGEEGIGNVTLILLDSNNQEVARTKTNSAGYYEFTNLAPGLYSLVEIQPVDWLDGKDAPGNRGGVAQNPGDKITGAVLVAGLDGINYDFGELKPGSIQGRVHADEDGDCEVDPGEVLLEGVVVHLLDSQGNILQTTTTDSQGFYKFDNLPPGVYGIQEIQPQGYFHQSYHIGSGSGTKVKQDNIMDINIGSGQDLVEYDFCEAPPAQISGYVFQDGATITNPDGIVPANIYDIRTGTRTSDDTPLANVWLELRHGVTGEPIDASVALPGTYPPGPIRVQTDANGYYQFTGLPAGNYAVYQVQPNGYIDNLDTPGTLGGLAVNPNNPLSALVLNQLGVNNPHNDAILRIELRTGQSSLENNFSEILVRPETPVFPPEDPEPPTSPPPLAAPRLNPPLPYLPPPPPSPVRPELYSGSELLDYTWHLSVVDAGQPRSIDGSGQLMHLTSAQFDAVRWHGFEMNQSGWTLADASPEGARELIFGQPDAIPVSGDFNGDGITEVGVYIRGDWFIDVNGNGIWDEADLWAHLGDAKDRPVTGDWDGDGKDDIGIFGPEWIGDPRAVKYEPGLPDPENFPSGRTKNVPPNVDEATVGERTMKLTSEGKLRSDLIDHVFYYGNSQHHPITGDWNGDGIKTIGLFRDGEWILDTDGDGRLTKSDLHVQYGQPGDRPVVGDWNGDGIDEIGVYRDGVWTVDTNGNHSMDAVDKVFEYGGANDVPVVGDWDGDGVDQAGLYHRHIEKTARVNP